jgi:hypothetical protein
MAQTGAATVRKQVVVDAPIERAFRCSPTGSGTSSRRSGRVHSDRVESELSQAVNQPAIATTDIENPGARWLQGSDNLVEVLPPSRIGHTPEPYPLSLPHRHLALSPNTTILVYPRPPRRRQSQVSGRRV